MSYYETAEQRQIRELRSQVSSANRRNQQTEAQNRELQERIRRNEEERRRAQERFDRAVREQQQRIRAQEQQNQRLSESVRNLDREIRQQEQQHQQRISQLRQEHQRAVREQNARLEQESRRLQQGIRENRQEMERLRSDVQVQFEDMQARRERDLLWTREQIGAANQRINDLEQQIAQDKQRQRELAEYWLSQAERLLEDIRENYRPTKFEPQKWRDLNQHYTNAQSDFRSEMYQTAVSNGRGAFQEASALRDSLIEQEFEWQARLEAARQVETVLIQQLAEAKGRVYTFDLDGEKIEDTRGVDYWTYGRLAALEQQIAQTRARLDQNTENLTTEQLVALEAELHQQLTDLAALENAAEINLTMARGRYSMAERIGAVLGDQYLMDDQDGDYFGTENRDEYHATFTNPSTGEQATVVITPIFTDESGIVTNHAEVLVSTPTNDPARRTQVNDSLVTTISREVPDFKLPCSEQHGAQTNEEAERLGNISAVSEGEESVRSRCSSSGVTFDGRRVSNPATKQ